MTKEKGNAADACLPVGRGVFQQPAKDSAFSYWPKPFNESDLLMNRNSFQLFDSYDAFGPAFLLLDVSQPTIHDLLGLRRPCPVHGFGEGRSSAHIFNQP
jgi:hypothetical protein